MNPISQKIRLRPGMTAQNLAQHLHSRSAARAALVSLRWRVSRRHRRGIHHQGCERPLHLRPRQPEGDGLVAINPSTGAMTWYNQHKQIKGYRDLTPHEIGLMNRVKEKASEVGVLMDELRATPGLDQRWVSIAVTDLQKGFMCAIRGIAQPESF